VRVISGSARGHKLKKVPGETTRPITDRVKENLFNILGEWVVESTWLDLFAGTGQVGIEALSRGAARVIFVDNARLAVNTIWHNLRHTKLQDSAEVVLGDAFQYLNRDHQLAIDIIFVAPPQYKGIWQQILSTIDQDVERYLSPSGMVIVQIDPKEYQDVELSQLNIVDRRKYGNTMVCFYGVED
jgi:16S rRNA (guanine(966)-N(2))-methyltransferase RsmD